MAANKAGLADSVNSDALNQIFRTARTRDRWTDRPVSEATLRDVYDLMKMGPTSANCCRARFVWFSTPHGKQRLAALAHAGNRAKILAAPHTIIIGYDLDFARYLPTLFHAAAEFLQALFQDRDLAEATAFRNGSLQGGYLILAARAVGLDTGPMSGFDNQGVDEQFFSGTNIRSNFICSIGYGFDETLPPRNPRLSFEETGTLA